MINPTEHPRWRRATRCASAGCVEVAQDGEQYLVRDSKNPERAPLRFTKPEWEAFLAGAREGDFDF